MGAWGLGLFQSDHDLDLVAELDWRAGCQKQDLVLRSMNAIVMGKMTARQAKDYETEIKQDPRLDLSKSNSSLYAENATSPESVRKFVEDPKFGREQGSDKSTVTEMIEYYTVQTRAQRPHLRNPYGDAYKTVLLGACFMTLGCHLPGAFKDLLREISPKVGLMRDGLAQMRKALGKKGYKDGEPWKFHSTSQDDMQSCGGPPREDLLYPHSQAYNTAGPSDVATAQDMAHLEKQQQEGIMNERAILWALGHRGQKICTGCQEGGHGQLHICGSCKTSRYCSRTCQAADFAVHKMICLTIKQFVTLSKRAKVFVGNRGPLRGMRDSLLDSVTDNVRKGAAASGSTLDQSAYQTLALPAPPGMSAVRVEEVDSDGDGDGDGTVEEVIDRISSAMPGGWAFGA